MSRPARDVGRSLQGLRRTLRGIDEVVLEPLAEPVGDARSHGSLELAGAGFDARKKSQPGRGDVGSLLERRDVVRSEARLEGAREAVPVEPRSGGWSGWFSTDWAAKH